MIGLPCEDGSSNVQGTGQYARDDLIQRMDPFLSRQNGVFWSSAGFPSRHGHGDFSRASYIQLEISSSYSVMAFEVATLTALESN